ncbi:flavodoxin [Gammaproteobacteria bacterium 45_16_T64]|nr:flavodoxin [Gammaproteobacteria bacterium 45_16_T64]
MAKQLLIVAHAPSPNTRLLVEHLQRGAQHPDIEDTQWVCKSPFDTVAEDVLNSQGILLFTPENLGYMSGALKDFFDRIYYPCLEKTQALPYGLCVRAGHDGTGTCRAIETITTGLRWRLAQPHLVCKGDFQSNFLEQCEELSAYMALALDNGIL